MHSDYKLFLRSMVLAACGVLASRGGENDILIENQFTNVVVDSVWNDVYVGKYTSGNHLSVSNGTLRTDFGYIGFNDSAHANSALVADGTWQTTALQIGSISNQSNKVIIRSGGNLEIAESLSIYGAAQSNQLILAGGTLTMESDFDAALPGFVFLTNSTLEVGGKLSNLETIDGSYTVGLVGNQAEWIRTNDTAIIGVTTDENRFTLSGGADFSALNLMVGNAGLQSNVFEAGNGSIVNIEQNIYLDGIESEILSSGDLNVGSNLFISGTSNTFAHSGGDLLIAGDLNENGISNVVQFGGISKLEGNLKSTSGIRFEGGSLDVFKDIDMESVNGNGTLNVIGNEARWTNNNIIAVGAEIGGTELIITDNAVVRTDAIQIGSEATAGSAITIQDGGKLILSGTGSEMYTNNFLKMESDSWLTFEQDESASFVANGLTIGRTGETQNRTFEFHRGAFVFTSFSHAGGDTGEYTEEGKYAIRGGDTFLINGASATLMRTSGNLHVGDLSSDNTLIITNGAFSRFKSLSIGDFKEGGNDNLVLITGNGSWMYADEFAAIGGTYFDNDWHEGGLNNRLRVEDMGIFTAEKLYNRNSNGSSGLEIASGAIVAVDEYFQGAGAYLTIFSDSAGTNVGHLAANMADFEQGARVGFDAVSKLATDQMYTNSIITADTLIINGVTNGTSSALNALQSGGGSLVAYEFDLLDGTNIVAMYRRQNLSAAGGFDPESIIADISDEIDFLASQGNAAASNQLQILSMLTPAQVNAQMSQVYVYGLPTFEHDRGIWEAVDQVRTRGASFYKSGPGGAYGPPESDSSKGYQPWFKVYGGFGNRDGSGSFNDDYDVNSYGTLLGIDRAFGKVLFGLAGGYSTSTLSAGNGDESDAGTGYGMIYGSYGAETWFADMVLSHGLTSIDNESGSAFDISSSTDASQTAFYFGAGAENANPDDDQSVIRSVAGLQVGVYNQDAYTETSSTAVAKEVDAFDRWSYQSILGVELVIPTYGLKVDLETELRGYWLHEFNDDEEIIGYSLVGSGQAGKFVMRSPEADVGQAGIGVAALFGNGLKVRADIDGQWSKRFFSATFSGSLLYEF